MDIGKHISEWKDVTRGVPQGSVLEPLLFVLYINDFPANIHHKVKLYADDKKIKEIINSPEYAEKLQSDINKVVEWSNQWLISLNIE